MRSLSEEGSVATTGPDAAQGGESLATVVVAIATNAGIACAKLAAAAFTGSAAMAAEAIHSAVDTANEAILLLGIARSRKPADRAHPFGYGLELYFWTIVVAVLIFGIGGVLSIGQGVERLLHPQPVRDVAWNYAVLGVAAVFETVSWRKAAATMRESAAPGRTLLAAVLESKDSSTVAVLVEDSAALAGLAIALAATFAGTTLAQPLAEGVGSLLIGMVLAAVAGFLLVETHGLLIGESASEPVVEDVRARLAAEPAIAASPDVLSMQWGPHAVVVNARVRFEDGTPAQARLDAIGRVRAGVLARHPTVRGVYVDAGAGGDLA